MCSNANPSDREIADVLITHSDALVLTVSRNAAQRVNSITIDYVFAGQVPLAIIQYANEVEMTPVYEIRTCH